MRFHLTLLHVLTASALIAISIAPTFGAVPARLQIQSLDGTALSGSVAVLSGKKTIRRTADASGIVDVSGLAGTFVVTVSHAGFTTTRTTIALPQDLQDGVLAITLEPNDLSSLREIGAVTSHAGATAINRSTAASTVVSEDTFEQQGVTAVTKILDETPGVTVPRGASSQAVPNFNSLSVRGAFPYESATFIDGHPTTSGFTGGLIVGLISPYVLQNTEIVRGPGAFADNLNDAIMGTVNFRLLEPTSAPAMTVLTNYDSLNGSGFALRATGTVDKLGYAVAYSFNGTPGAGPNYHGLYTVNSRFLINGAAVSAPSVIVPVPGANLNVASQYPAVLCCEDLNQENQLRNELVKVRYAVSPVTTVSLGYWGSQFFLDQGGANNGIQAATFVPAAAYSGSIPTGSFANDEIGVSPYYSQVWANLFEAELDTRFAGGYFRGRIFRDFDDTRNYRNLPPNYTLPAQLYGTISQGGVATTYNGQAVNVTLPIAKFNLDAHEIDRLNGVTFDYQLPIGSGSLAASYDSTLSAIDYAEPVNSTGAPIVIVPAGTSTLASTYSVRGSIPLGTRGLVTLGLYDDHYLNRLSPTAGSFVTTASSYAFPRLGVAYSPSSAVSLRFAAGGAITPAPLNFLATTASTPLPDNQANPNYYTQTINNLALKPETAFGFDVGADAQLGGAYVASLDLYRSNLNGQYLNTSYQTGTYQSLPLYTTQYINLGSSIYEGIEFGVRREQTIGLGFVVQGALLRNYVPSVSPTLYQSAAGPMTVNLGILPGANYNATSSGFALGPNGLALGDAVPYSMGYTEINVRGVHQARAFLGMTYYGPNNSFDRPAFVVFNGGLEHEIAKGAVANLTVDNLGNILPGPFYGYFGAGINAPLANGQFAETVGNVVGPRTVRLTLMYKR